MTGQRGLLDALLGIAYEDAVEPAHSPERTAVATVDAQPPAPPEQAEQGAPAQPAPHRSVDTAAAPTRVAEPTSGPASTDTARTDTASTDTAGSAPNDTPTESAARSVAMPRVGLLGGLLGLLEEEEEQPVKPLRRVREEATEQTPRLASPGPDGRPLRAVLDDEDLGPAFVLDGAKRSAATDDVPPSPVDVVPPGAATIAEIPAGAGDGAASSQLPPPPVASSPSAQPLATDNNQVAPVPPVHTVPPPPVAPSLAPSSPPAPVVIPPPPVVDDIPPPPAAASVPAASGVAEATGSAVDERELDMLADELASLVVARRREALRGLFRGPLTQATVELVTESLSDPEVDVRHLALQVLERVPELVPAAALNQVVYDTDASVRARAVAIAGRSGDPSLLPMLSDRMADEPDDQVLTVGIDALAALVRTGNLGRDELSHVCRIVGALTPQRLQRHADELRVLALAMRAGDLVDRLQDTNDTLRTGAAVLAAASEGTEALRALAGLVDDEIAIIRRLAIAAVAASRSADEVVDRDLPVTRAQPRTRDAAVETTVLPGLVDALADPQPQIRQHALAAIGRLDRQDVASWVWTRSRSADVDLLCRLLEISERLSLDEIADPLVDALLRVDLAQVSAALRSAAAHSGPIQRRLATLQSSTDPAERVRGVQLAARLAAKPRVVLEEAFRDTNADVRVVALQTAVVCDVASALADVIASLIAEDGSARVRVAALQAMRGLDGRRRLDAANVALQAQDAHVRIAAVELLDPRDHQHFALLARALHDRDVAVAKRAVEVFEQQQPGEVLALLWGQLRDADRKVQQLIVEVLVALDADALRRLARQAIDSVEPAERAIGLVAIAAVMEPSDFPRIVEALQDPAPTVRIQALETMAAQSGPFSIEPVVTMLRDPEPTVRAAAVRVASGIEDDELLAPMAASLDDPSREVRDATRIALRSVRSPKLIALLADELARPAQRAAVAELLAAMGDDGIAVLVERLSVDDPANRETLTNALRAAGALGTLVEQLAHPRAVERRQALKLVGRLGDPSLVDAVAARLNDPDPDIRVLAAELLGEFRDERAVAALRAAFGNDPDMRVVAAVEAAYRKVAADG